MKKIVLILVLIVNMFAEEIKFENNGNFILTMSKDNEMCQHFLFKFQNDIYQNNGIKPEEYSEFKFKWNLIRIKDKPYNHLVMKYKNVDLNHDGADELLVFMENDAFYEAKYPFVYDSMNIFSKDKEKYLKLNNLNLNELLKNLGTSSYNLNALNKNYSLKEFPAEGKNPYVKNKEVFPFIGLMYQGLRLMKYKKKDYIVMFGSLPSDDFEKIHFNKKKIFEKTIIVISKLEVELKKRNISNNLSYSRSDTCYYIKLK